MTRKHDTKTLVLLDVHAILHRAYHALPGFSSSKGEPTGALYGLSAMLIKIIKELKPDYIAACYDLPEPTFRHEAYEAYKAGRAKAEDDLIIQIKRSRDIFEAFGIPVYEHPGFEADDILGTIAGQVKKDRNPRVIIASGDMDTLQLVDDKRVLVYTLKKGINDTILYDEDAVKKRFGFPPKLLPDYKGLRGDPSDNIIGVAGIGEKTATALIQAFGTIEEIYKQLKDDEAIFEKKGFKPRIVKLLKENKDEALFSKTLATIRTDAPITFSLPKQTWQKSFDVKKVEALFAELEFRGLRDRVREIAGGEEGGDVEEDGGSVSERDVKEAAIALWLINSDITNPTLKDILEFTGKQSLPEAKRFLEEKIVSLGLERVYHEIELPLIPIIKEAQEWGIGVDVAYLKQLSQKYHRELTKLEKKIWKLAGGEFNINSPKQLGEVLFDKLGLSAKGLKKTAGGARSTRESELLKLRGEHEIIDHILSYREIQKLLSTYIDNIPKMVDKSGRLHTTLNQAGTTTGRMSSQDPNMQNIPSGGAHGSEIRNAFVAQSGHSFLSFDYSQIEMRILAELADDEKLKAVFREGRDVHASVAAFVFGVPESEVTKEMRRKAKVINFGIIYGMGVNALRENLGGTRAEAQEFYNSYFAAFPKIASYFESVKANAHKDGYTKTLFGRIRHFSGINSSVPYIRAMAERMALNAPIQGTAADIIKIAMRKADEALQKNKIKSDTHLILQIHDELMYEVKDERVSEAREAIKAAMEDFPEISVPLTVNISSSKRWGEMK